MRTRSGRGWGYGHCLNLDREAVPHEGFKVLREIGGNMPGGISVFNSNVASQ